MAIRDGESAAAPAPPRRTRPARAQRPGLFYRTVIPSGAVTATAACCIIPALGGARQLAVASAARLTVYSVDARTEALREIAMLRVFAHIRDIRAVFDRPYPVAMYSSCLSTAAPSSLSSTRK
eukprot:IDg17454t1